MRYIKASTKQGKYFMNRAECNEGFYLEDVYGSCSEEKKASWRRCLEMCNEEGGSNFHICSHNTFQYTVSWEAIREGEHVYRVETANNSYCVLLEQ